MILPQLIIVLSCAPSFFTTAKVIICGNHVMVSLKNLVAALLAEALIVCLKMSNLFKMAGNVVY